MHIETFLLVASLLALANIAHHYKPITFNSSLRSSQEEDMKVFDEDEEYITESFKKKRRLSKKSSKASKPTPQVRLDKERRMGGTKDVTSEATTLYTT